MTYHAHARESFDTILLAHSLMITTAFKNPLKQMPFFSLSSFLMIGLILLNLYTSSISIIVLSLSLFYEIEKQLQKSEIKKLCK